MWNTMGGGGANSTEPPRSEKTVAGMEEVIAAARECLVVRVGTAAADLWLWEHSQRVMELARMLARLPDVGEEAPHRAAVMIAALFHDSGWAEQIRQGQISAWQVLGR